MTYTVASSGISYPTPQAAIDACDAGGTVLFAPGTYPFTSDSDRFKTLKAITLKCVGGRARFDGSALVNGSVYLAGVQTTDPVLIDGLEFVGNRPGYCSGIATFGPFNLTIRNGYIARNGNGILTGREWKNGILNVEDTVLEDNGTTSAQHNIYTDVIDELNLLRVRSTMSLPECEGHLVKSRARKLSIKSCELLMLKDATHADSDANRCVDFPNGGELLIEDSILQYLTRQNVGAGQEISFGVEGLNILDVWDNRALSVALRRNLFINRSSGRLIWTTPELLYAGATVAYDIADNIIVGFDPATWVWGALPVIDTTKNRIISLAAYDAAPATYQPAAPTPEPIMTLLTVVNYQWTPLKDASGNITDYEAVAAAYPDVMLEMMGFNLASIQSKLIYPVYGNSPMEGIKDWVGEGYDLQNNIGYLPPSGGHFDSTCNASFAQDFNKGEFRIIDQGVDVSAYYSVHWASDIVRGRGASIYGPAVDYMAANPTQRGVWNDTISVNGDYPPSGKVKPSPTHTYDGVVFDAETGMLHSHSHSAWRAPVAPTLTALDWQQKIHYDAVGNVLGQTGENMHSTIYKDRVYCTPIGNGVGGAGAFSYPKDFSDGYRDEPWLLAGYDGIFAAMEMIDGVWWAFIPAHSANPNNRLVAQDFASEQINLDVVLSVPGGENFNTNNDGLGMTYVPEKGMFLLAANFVGGQDYFWIDPVALTVTRATMVGAKYGANPWNLTYSKLKYLPGKKAIFHTNSAAENVRVMFPSGTPKALTRPPVLDLPKYYIDYIGTSMMFNRLDLAVAYALEHLPAGWVAPLTGFFVNLYNGVQQLYATRNGPEIIGNIITVTGTPPAVQPVPSPQPTPITTDLTPSPFAGLSKLADEGSSFTLQTDAIVRYGAIDKYVDKTLHAGIYTANNDLFGDPIPGTLKAAYLLQSTTPVQVPPIQQPPAQPDPVIPPVAPTRDQKVAALFRQIADLFG